jgi:hypothetical protein
MAILSASTPFLIFMNVVINGRSNKGGAIARPRLDDRCRSSAQNVYRSANCSWRGVNTK